jgi:hypothetical protein
MTEQRATRDQRAGHLSISPPSGGAPDPTGIGSSDNLPGIVGSSNTATGSNDCTATT